MRVNYFASKKWLRFLVCAPAALSFGRFACVALHAQSVPELVSETAPVTVGSPRLLAWGRALFVSYDAQEEAGAAIGGIVIYGQDGHIVSQPQLTIPEASSTRIIDVIPSDSQGAAVASVLGVSSNGERASLLCFFDRDGKIVRTVRTNPSAIQHLTVAADGSVWGLAVNTARSADYPLVQRFSADGILAGAFLMRSSVPAGVFPPALTHNEGRPLIVSSSTTVAVYIPHYQYWAEFSLSGNTIMSATVPLPLGCPGKPTSVENLAITQGRAVFASIRGCGNFAVYELDRTNKRWVSTYSLSGTNYSNVIVGTDGENGVFSSHHGQQVQLGEFALQSHFAPSSSH